MLYENLKDAAIIVHNILNQPLSIQENKEDITMLSAAISFDENGMPASHLQQVMQTFVEYSDPTETLIRELDILSEELTL
ncbi:MAG: hypothetical protein EBZ47_01785 [Chlamydiae bacterium]|nr:hypothetical protein [Chlamydiota bacterium]